MVNIKQHDSVIFQLRHQCGQFINSLKQVKIWPSVDDLLSVIQSKDSLKHLVDEMPQSDAKENLTEILSYDDAYYIKLVATTIPFLDTVINGDAAV
ncbi:hypothetical protein KFE26_17890 [Shewanella sp. M16]|jgi:hypothetical protein|uniref:hypothetical protein n=1 Tax=Shewanella sp. M16 TaxID=2830837 RepID=UPI001BB09B6F|nr:hypothetical protein [Shewanella sp. M16]MBS0044157.1 hypothetical protein [Shewanella sp. M16]